MTQRVGVNVQFIQAHSLCNPPDHFPDCRPVDRITPFADEHKVVGRREFLPTGKPLLQCLAVFSKWRTLGLLVKIYDRFGVSESRSGLLSDTGQKVLDPGSPITLLADGQESVVIYVAVLIKKIQTSKEGAETSSSEYIKRGLSTGAQYDLYHQASCHRIEYLALPVCIGFPIVLSLPQRGPDQSE